MTAHPMRSLKSSVGTKNGSSFHAGASSFQQSSAARVAECFVFRQEKYSTGLHSSWISRLLSTATSAASIQYPANTSLGDFVPGKLNISSDESRTPSSFFHNSDSSIIHRCLGFAHINPTPPPPLPTQRISRGDGDGRLVASFGPFKVREIGKSAEMVFGTGVFVGEEREGGKVRALKRKMEDEAIGGQISPLVVQFRPCLTSGGAGILEKGIAGIDPVSSSRLQGSFGPWKVEGRLKTPVFGSFLASGGSVLDDARRRGAAYRDLSDYGSLSRSFRDIHSLHDSVVPQQPGIQIRKEEAEEPFSFWNMGRFKRANFVSSVSPSFDLSWNFDRKRKPIAELISSSKCRRM
ncbi:uncharacterized protein LOC110098426 [Dendrobium catenatum]|uniref:Uncharacterized protein n=1 Tax=Dendrobium catenatum TaxID=906689 RepID=A0A2I0XEZ8_9ASPA|nr:uncharacterized protein LOC110098426 [Dendrobium catenatum]PKU86491.1 hypothetical protein MA16_Dca010527 [Dendrobium catenatum]